MGMHDRLVIKGFQWTREDVPLKGVPGERGIPVLMSGKLVPEAKAWVSPYLGHITETIKREYEGAACERHMHDKDQMYLFVGNKDAATFEVSLGDSSYRVTTPASVYIPALLSHSIKCVHLELGTYGGVCSIYLDGAYDKKDVPKGHVDRASTKELVVDEILWVPSLPDHDGGIPGKGFPILMNTDLVKDSRIWACPSLLDPREMLPNIPKVLAKSDMSPLKKFVAKIGIKVWPQKIFDIFLSSDAAPRANLHTHDGDEMYLILGEENGAQISVTLGKEHFEVSCPAAVYIPAGLPHAIRASRMVIGKFGGACPVYLGTEYITKAYSE